MNRRSVLIASGRGMLAMLFVLAGVAKILNPQPYLEHMAEFHVPGLLLPLVIAFELGAGILLLSGRKLAYSAGAFAFFCLLTAGIFHHQWGVAAERTQFFKDLALAGALIMIAINAGLGVPATRTPNPF